MRGQVGPIYRDERDLERASSETRQKIESEVEALLQVSPSLPPDRWAFIFWLQPRSLTRVGVSC